MGISYIYCFMYLLQAHIVSNEIGLHQATYELQVKYLPVLSQDAAVTTRTFNKSLPQCGIHCFHGDCDTFHWRDTQCNLNNGFMSKRMQAYMTAREWQHFVRADLCEMLGYEGVRDTGLCIRFHPQAVSHAEAVKTCAGHHNGHLLVIDRESKLTLIRLYLHAKKVTQVVLIDGSDKITEGSWLYHDGRRITYQAWGGVEPVRSHAEAEDCLASDPLYQFWLNDVLCDELHPFFCEISLY